MPCRSAFHVRSDGILRRRFPVPDFSSPPAGGSTTTIGVFKFKGDQMLVRLLSLRVVRWKFAVAATVFMVSTTAYGQNIAGKVLDPQGRAVADAQIHLFDRNGGDMRSTMSANDGAYSFQGIPAGTYLVEADASGTLRGSQEV